MTRMTFVGFAFLFAATAYADTIVLNGTTYTGVQIRESGTRYYVGLPGGKTMSVLKADIKPEDVKIDKRLPQPAPVTKPGQLETPEQERAGPSTPNQAPDFDAHTVDGKPMRFSEYRGRYVLLVFWTTRSEPCRAETTFLKALFDAFGSDHRFVMIGLNLDSSADAPRTYAQEHGCPWVQGFLGDRANTPVPNSYGVSDLPAIFLIGPDGSILARRLRGVTIQQAVASALQGLEPSVRVPDRIESTAVAGRKTAFKATGSGDCMEFTIQNPDGLPEISEYECVSFRQRIIEKTPTSIHIRTETLTNNPVMRQRYPVEDVPEEFAVYLNPTSHIQIKEPAIDKTAQDILTKTLPRRAHHVVEAVLAYVSRHMQYRAANEVPDAVSCQNRRYGNCIGFTHLATALLRDLGIPCRTARMYIVQVSGHLNEHSIVEVYYPEDEAWVLYEPQCGGVPPSPQCVYAYNDADWNQDGQNVIAGLINSPRTEVKIVSTRRTRNVTIQ